MVLRLLQLLLLLAVLRAVWRLVKGVLEGAGYRQVPGASGRATPAVKLVRDPNCGTFVAPERAAVTRLAGQTVYFCSEKCRQEWERR
jgi:YHS domain-containing protein